MGKILGYILIVAIFVAAAYCLAVGQGGNKGQLFKKNTKTSEEQASASATPVPLTTKITIYAAGTIAGTEYPNMELKIDGIMVKSWKGVKGDAVLGKFDEFVYDYPGIISGQVLQVGFTNDLYIAPDEDRNLYVDKVVVGDTVYLADSPATSTTITQKSSKKCSDGNTYSRWLLCNGYFTFKSYDQAFVPQPTMASRLLSSGSLVKIYAAGRAVGGDYPMFDLSIKNKKVASFKVAGDPVQRILGEYTFIHPEKVNISEVSILYTNDYYGGVEADRNLYIDRINIDGADYFGDGYSVYQTGVWQGNQCVEGYLRSKLLWCPGATMKFGVRPTPVKSK